jgi:nitroreductase
MELDFIYQRHSVRQFKDQPVPKEDILKILEATIQAPSGKNAQNWQFVVITDKAKITEIAKIVETKIDTLATFMKDEKVIHNHKKMVPYYTVFKKAPVLILVYAGPYPTIADVLLSEGIMPKAEAQEYAKAHPGIQNIGAAMENLLLSAAALGYGGCYMTGPTSAAKEITEYLGFDKPGFDLAAMTPLGIPAAEKLSSPPRKPLEESVTFID